MNLQRLFKTQAILDKHILDKHNLHGEDLLDKKILALQVELGELANEWEMFKFWKDNPKPRTYEEEYSFCRYCKGKGEHYKDKRCPDCKGDGRLVSKIKNPLLEEYVDCLHFILSIGNDLDMKHIDEAWISEMGDYSEESTTETFIKLIDSASSVYLYEDDISVQSRIYEELFLTFIALGLEERHLGFTWEQIEQAYFDKNKINHERQEQGY